MKKLASIIVGLALAGGLWSSLAGCGFVSGSGKPVTKLLHLGGYSRVEVGSAFQVRIGRADDYAVNVTLDDNLLQYLEAEVNGDTLHLGLQDGNSYNDVTLKAVVVLPRLAAVQLSGACRGRLRGFNALEPLRVGLSGDSSLRVVDLRSSVADLELSGSSDLEGNWVMTRGSFGLSGDSQVRLTGAVGRLSLDVSGSSTCELARFRAERLEARLSGSSDGAVHVTDTLAADLSGASVLEYLGDPKLGRIETSGNSEVRRAE